MKKVFKYLGIFIAGIGLTVGVLNIVASDEKEIAIVIEQEVNAPVNCMYSNQSVLFCIKNLGHFQF